ncbi:hypothetical protein A1O3_08500 [Capronia epimyces CBS 606.96]|uniref:Uncharacterized protein n=1 Tax=Capronia epimyces CBS 606.96 TaxID=1182542 RepID=W9Y9D9_9EURO|nr:uncharacterized protein A1O3_08500 [Capronia epimyces CBS 606.96]EXJ78999.1 hypothetical protein A1O3_08500 [Capronia epimyces CBS 606.96]
MTEVTEAFLLNIFSNKLAWEVAHKAALESSKVYRKGLLSRLAYLTVLKQITVPDLLERCQIIKSKARIIDAQSVANHYDWMLYWLDLPDMVDEVVKHANWVKLLEEEYIKIEPVWRDFWSLMNEPDSTLLCAPVMPVRDRTPSQIYRELAEHNTKRTFLQTRILEGKEFLLKFYKEPPAWSAWGTVETEDSNLDEERNTGFVEELEEDEGEEEFEL